MNVDGLLQVEDGYYVYNSQENFAEYDESSNTIRRIPLMKLSVIPRIIPGQQTRTVSLRL